ncbi:hypothetical protein [Mechercharimyces sp. CAU 1602]|uniref:hypothetical protein n=1 Tax=Mechercharimyces sp. CAU 1602 TaxID=2973933 RepID=UPI0021619298|nr:hypothetical protein [Mechercharimyces sp. CAU 1602]MCS1350299.1 hypothetical protein [Mechercharimyces sp. CAU 1602]
MDIRKRGDGTAVIFKTNKGEITFSDYPYSPYKTIMVRAGGVRMHMPLKRHIRTLVEIFGFEAVSDAINNYPESLRKQGGDD